MVGILADCEKDAVMVKVIKPEFTLNLRREILRPHLTVDQCRQNGDTDLDTRHFGAYRDADLLGVASVYRESVPGTDISDSWRLRGMAVQDCARDDGIGTKLIRQCIDYVTSQNGKVFWCYSRTSATQFYEKKGFSLKGEVFEFPHVGPVILMVKDLV